MSNNKERTDIRNYEKNNISGGILSGTKIIEEVDNGNIVITPFDKAKVNPNSYNLTINEKLLVYPDNTILDFKKHNSVDTLIIPEEGMILYPGKLYLGSTNEFCFTDKYVPIISGRSSTGRLGIKVHITAGYGDIGWKGKWTLEIAVELPVRIYPNIEFCQIYYFTVFGNKNIQYNGRYQNQQGAVESRSNLEKKVYVND